MSVTHATLKSVGSHSLRIESCRTTTSPRTRCGAQELYSAGKKASGWGSRSWNAAAHARRHKQWTSTHEDIIKLYLLICVDLRQKQFAKDGLYQYRNLSQREAAWVPFEAVANYLLSLAEPLHERAQVRWR